VTGRGHRSWPGGSSCARRPPARWRSTSSTSTARRAYGGTRLLFVMIDFAVTDELGAAAGPLGFFQVFGW